MKSEMPLDYAVFQLSPERSRCELFVSGDGTTEKLASGSVKPFVTHLKVAKEQVALAVQSIRLEVEECKNDGTWFTKGTLERFVRFVSTPEVLELVNTLDAEMSQLEAAQRIYSQGARDQHSGAMDGDGTGTTAAADATKKELLRAIEVRLVAVRQDLTAACARASAAGFSLDTVSKLQLFADWFGAHRLKEACTKFLSLCQRRPELINQWKPSVDDGAVRSSYGSDMSIDDPNEDSCASSWPHHTSQNKLEQQLDVTQTQQPSTCQKPKSLATSVLKQRNNANEKKETKKEDTQEFPEKEVTQTESSSTPTQPSRRLSVQDRISLFENKQKSSGGGGESAGSGGKPIVGKSVELRRFSSDVSLAPTVIEKAVLRRWSGASDMSIDVSCEKVTESPLCTPSPVSFVSQSRSNNKASRVSEENGLKGLNDSGGPLKLSIRVGSGHVGDLGSKDKGEGKTGLAPSSKEEELGSRECSNWKDQSSSETQVLSFGASGAGQDGLSNYGVSKENWKISSNSEERSSGFKDLVGSAVQSRGFPDKVESLGETTGACQQAEVGAFTSKGGYISNDAGLGHKVGDSRQADNSFSHSHSRSFLSHSRSLSGKYEGDSGLKFKEPSSVKQKRVEGDQQFSQPQWTSFTRGSEHGEVDLPSSFTQLKVEDFVVERMNYQKQVSVVERMNYQKQVSASNNHIRKPHGRRDENCSVYENSQVNIVKKASMNQENSVIVSPHPVELVQGVRQTRGKQELHDELKMKANELEKLFAEHKLRIPGDKHADTQVEQAVSSDQRKTPAKETAFHFPERGLVVESTSATCNMTVLNTSPMIKVVDNQGYDDTLRQNFKELGLSQHSRGKLYVRYMQKRDAKLKEEWISNRAEKEAKLKSMQDSLERSRAELKTKFPGSAERQDSTSSAQRRAEKFRSFNVQSSMKWEQQPIESIISKEDEELSGFPGEKFDGEDKFFTEPSLGDGASGSYQNKKPLPNRNFTSSTPRTAVAPAPRSAAKSPYSNSGKRRPQSANLLTQSVPNFSDFRKENTKPSYAVSKTSNRTQVKTYTRSKSINEETPTFKEEKPRRSQSLRKSSANPTGFKDSSLNCDDIVLEPLKHDKEQTDQSLYDKFPKTTESKPFLRKGKGTGPGSGSGFAKLKTTMPSETWKIQDEFDEVDFEAGDCEDTVKEEGEEWLDSLVVEDCFNRNQGKPRLSHDSVKLGNFESDNGESMKSPSQVDTSSVAELPLPVSSAFQAVGSLLDSPGESPVSWNLRVHHSFSYQQESSDVDASVDSPVGSPAAWNSHGLSQTESDAARMRKKWGSAQKPVLATHASHNQSRKDVTKGFKRLLKFGRKTRGTESLADWISATTSEGDDDTEDGRDPWSRSSEDLRKSRMGYSQGPSDDTFNESEFNERVQALQSSIPAPPVNFKLRDENMSDSSLKAPRSFFSLSSFRSKGGDSKPR